MIDKLKNCPNCAGILNEAGRCTYCGSKIYDFLTVDFFGREAASEKTYIRIKANGKIILAPIRFTNAELTIKSYDNYIAYDDGQYVQRGLPTTEMDLHLMVVEDMIQIDEEAENE